MTRDLTTFFNPKSVAVVGASRSPEKVGAIVLKNIIESGFGGEIYPVNPEAETLLGKKCYGDISSLPEAPDLAAVALPAPLVIEVLGQLGEKGTKNIVVFTAGFKEAGEEGARLEEKLAEVARQYELNVLGPNCLGFVNNFCPINVTFGQVVKTKGNIRFISQSGAIAASLFDWAESTGAGFGEFVTLGNKAVLTENDILRYWQGQRELPVLADRERISKYNPIGLYLEQISDGQEFRELAKQISLNDPVFILKPGRSKAAARAMLSHTGAIAGEEAVATEAFLESGVIRAEGLEDFFDFARAFAWENPPSGPHLSVISNAGGPAVTIADAVDGTGLALSEFSEETRKLLNEQMPRSASIFNPVDVLGDALADQYAKALEIVLLEKETEGLIVILTPQVMTQIEKTAEVIGRASLKYRKSIMCSFIGGVHVAAGEEILNKYKIASFHFPERAVRAMAAAWRWQSWRGQIGKGGAEVFPEVSTEKSRRILEPMMGRHRAALNAFEAQEVMQSVGILVPSTQKVTGIEEARKFAEGLEFPVVLKLIADDLIHKSDEGGVVAGITDGMKLEAAWSALREKVRQRKEQGKEEGEIVIQKQITDGVEVIVGVKRDPTFGLTMMFGAGGTLAELIADRNLHLWPMRLEDANELILKSRVAKLLGGYRSSGSKATEKLAELMLKMGKLAEGLSEIAEIEANPVIVTANDAWAVDARIILKEEDA